MFKAALNIYQQKNKLSPFYMCHEHKNKEIRVMHNENYNYGLQRCKSEGCRILVL